MRDILSLAAAVVDVAGLVPQLSIHVNVWFPPTGK